jgi:hypothetical protein
MTTTKSVLKLLPIVLLVLMITGFGTARCDYPITLSWIGGYDPLVFSFSSFIPGDISDADEIEFNDIAPFFNVTINNWVGGENPPSPLYLWARLTTGDNQVIFSMRSRDLVDADEFIGSFNNQTLANPPIEIGEYGGGGLNERVALSLIDNSLMRDGFYRLTVVLTNEATWTPGIMGNNEGIAVLSIHVQNPTQVRVIQPGDGVQIHSNPIFIWRFPRQPGVTFNLDLVKGEEEQGPAEAMDSPSPANVYLESTLTDEDFVGQGVNIYVYTGIGDQRPLEDGNYFWQVTATVPGAFPGEWFTYESPINSFEYQTPGGGQGNAGHGGILGGGLGGALNPAPGQSTAIFTALLQMLPEDMVQGLFNMFGDLSQWNLNGKIIVDGREMNLLQFINWFMNNNPNIIMVSVS